MQIHVREVVSWPPYMYIEFIVAKAVWLIYCIDVELGEKHMIRDEWLFPLQDGVLV